MAVVMSWSECSIKIGKTGVADAMSASLTSIGNIKDKSTTLESTEGEKLQAKATGGKLIAQEEREGEMVLKTRVIEDDFAFLATLIGATNDSTAKELKVTSHIVADDYSVELSPKNVGATGLKIRKAHVSYKPGFSEEEGHFADLTFTVLECADGELYTKFTKKAV